MNKISVLAVSGAARGRSFGLERQVSVSTKRFLLVERHAADVVTDWRVAQVACAECRVRSFDTNREA